MFKRKSQPLTQQQIYQLQLSLTHFGLQPFEWMIKPIQASSKTFMIQHQNEPDFIFKGKIKAKSPYTWEYIQLVGI